VLVVWELQIPQPPLVTAGIAFAVSVALELALLPCPADSRPMTAMAEKSEAQKLVRHFVGPNVAGDPGIKKACYPESNCILPTYSPTR
jgi:hypothetical protein